MGFYVEVFMLLSWNAIIYYVDGTEAEIPPKKWFIVDNNIIFMTV